MLRINWPSALYISLTAGALVASSAQAHIDMVEPLLGRGGDQKVGPCEGKGWGTGPVYTFEPGETITLTVRESVSHDGYFRIAFDDAGDDDFVDPMSIDPVNPDRYGKGEKCAANDPSDRCGESDFCSFVSTDGGPTVLWDQLDPHIPNGLFNGKSWSWNVKLPDVECDQCTLQIMQIMEDAQVETPLGPVATHGPFDGNNDLYYRCVDIVLKRGAGESVGTTTAPVENNGRTCVEATMADGGVTPPDDVVVIVGDAGAQADPHDHDDEGGAAGPLTDGGVLPGSPTDDAPSDGPPAQGSRSSSGGGCSATKADGYGAGWASLFGVLALLGRAAVARRRLSRTP